MLIDKDKGSMNFEDQEKWEVPTYDEFEFLPKRNKYCICIFIINEGDRFIRQISSMKHLSEVIDIVVADGGSTDNSTEHQILIENQINTLLVKTGEGKLGSQMRMAFAWAVKRGYEGVVVIDGNGKDGIEGTHKFIAKLDEGYDHIQGSRFIPGGHHENTPLIRLIGLKILHVPLVRIASRFRYTDTTNGFRAYSSKLLKDEKIAIFRNVFIGYELHYYISIRAPRLKFKCTEVPVSRSYPKHGKTPSKIRSFGAYFDIVKKLFRVATGYYDNK